MTTKPGTLGRPCDIGAVNADGSDLRVLVTGLNEDIEIAGELS